MSHATKTTIGVDLGDRYSRYCVLSPSGEKIEEGRVKTEAAKLREVFGTRAAALVALEVGGHSAWTSRLLEELGHEVIVANARRVRLITESSKKSDRLDAEMLARLARSDRKLLSPIHHRSAITQRDCAALRARDALVRARTKLINCARGTTKAFGLRLPSCSAPSFHRKAWAAVPQELSAALSPLFKSLEAMEIQIREIEHEIEKRALARYPITRTLRTAPGVGPIVSAAYVFTIDDPHRFRRGRQVGAFLGLAPARAQSGERDPQKGISKEGDPRMRRLMVTASQYILGPFGPDCALRRAGLAIAARGGKTSKKRALVAVARKLAVVLHRMWLTGERFQAFPSSSPTSACATSAAAN